MKLFRDLKNKKWLQRKKNKKNLSDCKNKSNIEYSELPTKSILDVISGPSDDIRFSSIDYQEILRTPTSPPSNDIFVPIRACNKNGWLIYIIKEFFKRHFKMKKQHWRNNPNSIEDIGACTSMELIEHNEIICMDKALEYSRFSSKESKMSHNTLEASHSMSVLLPPIRTDYANKKCFVIDLDETLVHSSFKQSKMATLRVDVTLEDREYQIFIMKRPFVELFLKKVGPLFECVLFTASLEKYAGPVTDYIDKTDSLQYRLFREACTFYNGSYIKDLNKLGRNINQTVILDNFPNAYYFHPENAIPITSWYDDFSDTALKDLIPYCEALAKAPNVPDFLRSFKPPSSVTGGYDPLCSINRLNKKQKGEYFQKNSKKPPSSHVVIPTSDSIGKILTQVNKPRQSSSRSKLNEN